MRRHPHEGFSRVESRKSSEWGERGTTGALDEGKRRSNKRNMIHLKHKWFQVEMIVFLCISQVPQQTLEISRRGGGSLFRRLKVRSEVECN